MSTGAQGPATHPRTPKMAVGTPPPLSFFWPFSSKSLQKNASPGVTAWGGGFGAAPPPPLHPPPPSRQARSMPGAIITSWRHRASWGGAIPEGASPTRSAPSAGGASSPPARWRLPPPAAVGAGASPAPLSARRRASSPTYTPSSCRRTIRG